ncbi:uncharacterized protein LTR77_007658 [Saxophila tyrrhenica]|uniref:2-haloalkanoic acid dehalogenase n=1 Tax=Saxophila tyrrhenica TaxID=1690608 RepID=A0AAV9P4N9_9PEZI|nr:hypothetical protein LTR77_007658 [Saxophila tyrrhenica]
MSVNKNIVFDVVGTLASYDKLYEAVETTLGQRLREQGIKVPMFGYLWIEVAEREYAIVYRVLWKCGIEEPRKFINEKEIEAIVQGYADMEMRPGAAECISKLRNAGFTVWGLTMDDYKRVRGYFERSGIDMPTENLASCDSTQIGKPDPQAYKPLLDQLSSEGNKPWFAAAHQWDVAAARRTGFRGAYCTVWEGEALMDVFGDMDVVAETLPEMADRVIKMAR